MIADDIRPVSESPPHQTFRRAHSMAVFAKMRFRQVQIGEAPPATHVIAHPSKMAFVVATVASLGLFSTLVGFEEKSLVFLLYLTAAQRSVCQYQGNGITSSWRVSEPASNQFALFRQLATKSRFASPTPTSATDSGRLWHLEIMM